MELEAHEREIRERELDRIKEEILKRDAAAAHHHHAAAAAASAAFPPPPWLNAAGRAPPGFAPHGVPSTLAPHTAGSSFPPPHYATAAAAAASLYPAHSHSAATSALLVAAERDRYERMGEFFYTLLQWPI